MPGSGKHTRSLLAYGSFLGTVIGVGIFALPYLASRMGFLPLAALMVVLTAALIVLLRLFADLVLAFPEPHRIPGYVGKTLGHRWKTLSLVVSSLSLLGALLAYLIVGGTFFALMLKPLVSITTAGGAVLFFLLGSFLIARGTKAVAWSDLVLTAIFFVIVAVIFFAALPKLELSFLGPSVWSRTPLGYGVALFSLWGLSIVPEMTELTGRDRKRTHAVITSGLILTTIVYLVFALMVLGVTGHGTTEDALTGFLGQFPPAIVALGGLMGFITTITSYIALGITLRKTLRYDLGVRDLSAMGLTVLLPLIVYILGLTNLIDILGITGAVLLGAEGILVLLASRYVQKSRERLSSRAGVTILLALLVLGVIVELVTVWL